MSVKERIAARREDLRQRREVLAIARQAHEQNLASELQAEETISEERYACNLPAIDCEN